MSEQQAQLEKKDHIATITLNNPQTFNSMSQALLDDTLQLFCDAESDADVRVVIFTGAGKAFCAGADLPYVETFANAGVTRRYMEGINGVTNAIVRMAKPVIAMVNGVAAGAGCNWVLACDIIYCARSARLAQSFARVGLIPDGGGTYFLTRAVGLHRAKELAFTADVIDAQTAYQLGLVNKVFEDDQLRSETLRFASKLAAGAPVAIGMMKKALNQNYYLDLQASQEIEIGMQLLCMETEDHKEGIAAFKEKRAPVFKGR